MKYKYLLSTFLISISPFWLTSCSNVSLNSSTKLKNINRDLLGSWKCDRDLLFDSRNEHIFSFYENGDYTTFHQITYVGNNYEIIKMNHLKIYYLPRRESTKQFFARYDFSISGNTLQLENAFVKITCTKITP